MFYMFMQQIKNDSAMNSGQYESVNLHTDLIFYRSLLLEGTL